MVIGCEQPQLTESAPRPPPPLPLPLLAQGALILKILRGKFPPVTGYSAELQDIVKRCLTQAAQKRPSADRIIALPAVQEKAQALGITLPGEPPPPPPSFLLVFTESQLSYRLIKECSGACTCTVSRHYRRRRTCDPYDELQIGPACNL